MKNLTHMTILNHAPNLQALVQKLPVYLQNNLRYHVKKCHIQSNSVISFGDLVNFINFAATSPNDPVFSQEATGRVDARLGQLQVKE